MSHEKECFVLNDIYLKTCIFDWTLSLHSLRTEVSCEQAFLQDWVSPFNFYFYYLYCCRIKNQTWLHKKWKKQVIKYMSRENNLFRAQIKRTTRETILQPTAHMSVLPSSPKPKTIISLKKYRAVQRSYVNFPWSGSTAKLLLVTNILKERRIIVCWI